MNDGEVGGAQPVRLRAHPTLRVIRGSRIRSSAQVNRPGEPIREGEGGAGGRPASPCRPCCVPPPPPSAPPHTHQEDDGGQAVAQHCRNVLGRHLEGAVAHQREHALAGLQGCVGGGRACRFRGRSRRPQVSARTCRGEGGFGFWGKSCRPPASSHAYLLACGHGGGGIRV